jgi:hypothetical protein
MDIFSIGDFAESLISEEVESKGEKKAFSAPSQGAPNERDVSDVAVPDDYRQQLVASFLGEEVSPEVPTENMFGNPPEEQETQDTEIDQTELVGKLQNLIHELKDVLTEMTTTGMVGGHMGAKPLKKTLGKPLRKTIRKRTKR